MAYSQTAEKYATHGTWEWDNLWEDMTMFPTDELFKVSQMVGNCRTIANLSPKSQHDIIRAHLVAHAKLPAEADSIRRVTGPWFAWFCHGPDNTDEVNAAPRDRMTKLPHWFNAPLEQR